MKVSTRGRYALRLMLDLAGHYQCGYISLKDISTRQEISTKYLEQIVAQLCKAGFLKSVRGPQGGYMLSQEPQKYTVGSILRVMEGSLSPISCVEDHAEECSRRQDCPTFPFWQGLYELITEYVDRYTLEDLLNRQSSKEQNNFII